MDLLKKMEIKAKKASKLIKFEIVYHPGVTEEEDSFEAMNEEMSINCYGISEEKALSAAQEEAEARLMEQISLADKILKAQVTA